MLRTSLIVSLLLTSSLHAQTSDISESSSADISDITSQNENEVKEDKIEKIEVTGSHIKRIDIEGVSALENIDQEEFTKRGAIEISDVLKESPAFEAVYEGVGHVRFRGQHAGNVLILLNGMRMPKLDGGYYTSIRNIPTSAVGRVEMLKDGGSAVYGSDALSGVMNFITRTDLDGGAVNMSVNANEFGEGAQTNYDATFGKNFSKGNIMGVLQYNDNRSYNDQDLGSFNTDPEVVQAKGSSARISGSNSLSTGPTCADGSICSTDPLVYDQNRADNQNFSAMLTGKYEFQDFDVAMLGLFSRKDAVSITDPGRINWRDNSSSGGLNTAINTNDMLPSGYRDDVQAIANGDGLVNVSGSFVEELGDYITEAQENNYSVQTRVNGYVTDDWTWDVQAGLAITDFERTVVSGEADQNKLREMFINGEWDITAPFGEKSDLSAAKITPTYRSTGEMLTSKAVLAGEVYNSERFGSLSSAIGVEVQQESFKFENDQSLLDGTALARPTRNFEGEREVLSAFLEFSAMPTDKLEIQLAGRVDEYSDVGSTFNPKFGLSWRPTTSTLFRTSLGTGFRAPGITDLYAGEEQSLRFFEDTNCPVGPCDSAQNYEVTTYTSNETKPEEATTYSFGTVIQPTKNVSFSVDQWNFEGRDTLSAIYQEDYLRIEREQGQAALDAVGAEINRNGAGELESMRFRRVVNMGQRTLRGVDAALDGRIQLSKGRNLLLGASGMFIFERRTQRFAFEAEEDMPDTWKNRNFIGISNRNHFARFSMLTVSKALVGRGDNMETLPQYTEYDFMYSFTASWGGKFSFTIKNLANTRPPVRQRGSILSFARTDRNFSSFSPLRRRLFLSYNQTF
jgi:iron complex outermembrane receptor protein